MNKSKFLKKSLAALLAILMVAAMIPLSAAAQVIGNGETITASTGTLAKGEDDYNWTVTLPYTDQDGGATITLATDRQNVEFFKVEEDEEGNQVEKTIATGKEAQVSVEGVTVDAPKSVTIVLRTIGSDPAEVEALATYTVTVQKEATSNDATITGATVDLAGVTYRGSVDGTTITFSNIAWGKVPAEGTSNNADKPMDSSTVVTAKVTMDNKPDSGVFDVDAAPIVDYAVENGVGTGKITATAQNGDTKVYTVKFNEAVSFTGITVAGVAAVQDATNPTKWVATVAPEDVKANVAFDIKATAPKRIDKINYNSGTEVDGDTFTFANTSGILADETTAKTLTIKDNKGNTASANLLIKLNKNSDTGIKSFSVNDQTYTEQGNVSNMTVTMKKGTTNTTLATAATKGALTIHFNGAMKSATLNGTALVGLDSAGSAVAAGATFVSATNVSSGTLVSGAELKTGANTLVVIAEDGTQKTYSLNVAVATSETSNPSITGAVITLGDNDEKISAKVDQTAKSVTFKIPASLVADLDETAVEAIQWGLSAHTAVQLGGESDDKNVVMFVDNDGEQLETVVDAGGDEYTDYITNTALYSDDTTQDDTTKITDPHHGVTVVADSTNTQLYKVYFTAETANQVTRLTSIKFYDAETQGEVTADNTYEGKSNDIDNTVTIAKTLPYSLYTPGDNELAVSFEIAPRARIFWVAADKKITEFTKNGFDEKGRAQTGGTITGAELAGADKILVLSEAYTVGTITSGTTTFDPNTSGNEFYNKTGYKAYDLKVTKADASTANQLVSMVSADKAVTGVVGSSAVKLVVPTDYVQKDNETEFDLLVEISENAKVYKNAYNPDDLTENTPDVDDPIIFENVKVVLNEDGSYSLLHDGEAVTKFVVTAQDGSTVANYALTIEVADLDDDATISGITANGVAAAEGEDGWTVELPYGTEEVEVVATPSSDKAEASVVDNGDGTYTITVTAERGNIETYTLTVTIAEEPEKPDEPVFDDVPDWAQEAVSKAAEMGWMLGVAEGKFNPAGNIRRGDFALTIARILEKDWANVSAEYAKDVFADVKAGDWYYEAVAYVAEKGIMNGRANGFDPRTGITREEAAKVLCIALGLEKGEGDTTFGDDGAIAAWAKPYVKACQDAGIMSGTNGNFNPKNQLTRAETAQMLVSAFIDDEPEQPEEPAE